MKSLGPLVAPPGDPLPKTLAVVRIAVGLLFVLFGEFKVVGADFVPGLMQQYVSRFVEGNQAVGFYKAFLAAVVVPHTELFGTLVAWGELLIGLALVLGLLVRVAALAGALHMLSLTLASWNAPGPDAPLWQYFANQLDHLGLLFLFALFFAGNAGKTWGLDALGPRTPRPD